MSGNGINEGEIRVKKDQGQQTSNGRRVDTRADLKMARVSRMPIRGRHLPSLFEDTNYLPDPTCRGCVRGRIRPLELFVLSKTKSSDPLRSGANRGRVAASRRLSWRVPRHPSAGARRITRIQLEAFRRKHLSGETQNEVLACRPESQGSVDGRKPM